MPTGMQFNTAYPTPTMPPPGYGAPQIDYARLSAYSPYNAMQSLITSGLSPEQAYAAYQTWSQTGQGPQVQRANLNPQNAMWTGGERLQIGPAVPPSAGLQPQSTLTPQSQPSGGGFQVGAQNTPYNMTPFYMDSGANPGVGGGPVSSDPAKNIQPPAVRNPMAQPEIAPMQLGGGFGGGAPTQQSGMGGMTAGARREGEGMPEWQVGRPGQSRQEQGFQFLRAQGMDEARAKQVSGWTGGGALTASASTSQKYVNAFNAANQSKLAAARPAYEAARAREQPVSNISHSGGALLPQYKPPTPQYTPPAYTGIAGGQGTSINTFGTPGKNARLTASGYRY